MRWFLKRLYRERRRLVVVLCLTFLGGVIAFPTTQAHLFGLPFFLVAGLAFMFGLTAFLALLAILFPTIRYSAEIAAMQIPFLATIGAFGMQRGGYDGIPTWAIITGLVICVVAASLYTGPLLDRFLPLRKHSFTSHTFSTLAPDKLWPFFSQTPDTDTFFWDKDTLSMDWIEKGKTFIVTARMNDVGKIEEHHRLESMLPGDHFKFDFDVPDAKPKTCGARGKVELWVEPHGRGSRVKQVRTYDCSTWRMMVYSWVDDHFGRVDDDTVRRAETATG